MHGIGQHQTFFHPAFANARFHLPGDITIATRVRVLNHNSLRKLFITSYLASLN